MNSDKAKKITIKIIAAILADQNGYTIEEVQRGNIAENCEGSPLFTQIEEILLKH